MANSYLEALGIVDDSGETPEGSDVPAIAPEPEKKTEDVNSYLEALGLASSQRFEPQGVPRELAQQKIAESRRPKTWFGEFRNAVARGVDETQQTLYGGGAWLSDIAGFDSAKGYFLGKALQQDEEIAWNPQTIDDMDDVHNFDEGMRYFLGQMGKAAPQLAESAVTGLIGGIAGSAAGPEGTVIGGISGIIGRKAIKDILKSEVKGMVKEELKDYASGKIVESALSAEAKSILKNQVRNLAGKYGAQGALAVNSIAMQAGSIYTDLAKDPNITEEDRRVSSTIGGIVSAIPDLLTEGWIASKFFPGVKNVGKEQMKQATNFIAKYGKIYGKEILKVMPAEGGQEYIQTMIEEAAKNWADPKKRQAIFNYSPEQWKSFREAAVGGAAGGFLGGLVAGTGVALNAHPNPQVRQDQRQVENKVDDIEPIEATEGNDELESLFTQRDAMEAEIEKMKGQTDDATWQTPEYAAKKSELDAINARINDILAKGKTPVPGVNVRTPQQRQFDEIKSMYQEPAAMPQGQAIVTEEAKQTKRKELWDIIDQSDTDQSPEAVEFRNNYKQALEKKGILDLLTGGNVSMISGPKLQVAMKGDEISLTIPKYSEVGDKLKVLDSAMEEEAIHIADNIALRDQYLASDELKGKFKSAEEYAGSVDKERSDAAVKWWNSLTVKEQSGYPSLARLMREAYEPGKKGVAKQGTIAVELPRMMVQLARTGRLHETTETLATAAKAQKEAKDHPVHEFLRTWIDALKGIHKVIKKLFNFETAPEAIVKAYHEISAVLDKYGALQNQPPAAVREEASKPSKQAVTEKPTEKGEAKAEEAADESEVQEAEASKVEEREDGQVPDWLRANDLALTQEMQVKAPALVEKIVDLHAEDLTAGQIGQRLGIDTDIVRSVRRGLDLPEQGRGFAGLGAVMEGDPVQRARFEDWARKHNALRLALEEQEREAAAAEQPAQEEQQEEQSSTIVEPTPEATTSEPRIATKPTPDQKPKRRMKRTAKSVNAAIDTLTPEQKDEAAKALGAKSWNKKSEGQFKRAFADWLAGTRKATGKLLKAFNTVLRAIPRAVLSAIMVISPFGSINSSQINTDTVATQMEIYAEPTLISPDVDIDAIPRIRFDYQPTLPENQKAPSTQLIITLPKGGLSSTIAKSADFQAAKPTDKVALMANWVVANKDNGGASFIVADKDSAETYLFTPEGKLIQKFPALFGADRGDVMQGDSLKGGKKITPSGRFNTELDEGSAATAEYGGVTLDLIDENGDYVVSVHRIYNGHPEEKRFKRVDTPTPHDNRISSGCVNVSEQVFLDKIVPHARGNGMIVYILPEESDVTEMIEERQEQIKEEQEAEVDAIVNDSEGRVAGASVSEIPDMSQKGQRAVRIHGVEVASQTREVVDALKDGKSLTKPRRGQLDMENVNPATLDYATQPHTDSARQAHDVMDREGLQKVVGDLLETGGQHLGIIEDTEGGPENLGPGAVHKALYELSLVHLDHIKREMRGDHRFSRRDIDRLEETYYQVEKRMRETNTRTGQYNSFTGKLVQFWNALRARAAYIEPIMKYAQKIFGKKGEEAVDSLAKDLNALMAEYTNKAMNRSEMIAYLRHLEKNIHSKKWRDKFLKDLAASRDHAKRNTKRGGQRAAEAIVLNEDSKAYIGRVIGTIVKDMSGLAKSKKTQGEIQLFESVVNQIAREFSEEMGLIPEREAVKRATMEEKFAVILRNDALYAQFINGLRESFIREFGGDVPTQQIVDEANELFAKLANRWTPGMIDSLMKEKLNHFNESFAKIAKEVYSHAEDVKQRLKYEIELFMNREGITDPALIDAIVDDIDNAFEEQVEAARQKMAIKRGSISEALRSLGTTLAGVAKEHALVGYKYEAKLSKYLQDELGFPEGEANRFAAIMQRQLNKELDGYYDKNGKYVKGEREKVIDRWIKQVNATPRDKAKLYGTTEKILQAAAAGALRKEDVYGKIAGKFDLPPYSAEVAAEIERRGEVVANAPEAHTREIALQELTDYLNGQRGIETKDVWIAGMYFSMLSGLSTQMVNVGANALTLLGYVAVEIAKNPFNLKKIGQMIRALVRSATGAAQVEMRESFWTGLTLGKHGQKYFEGARPLDQENPVFTSNFEKESYRKWDIRAAKFIHKGIRMFKGHYVGRMLSAADIFFYKMAQDVAFTAKVGDAALGTPQTWENAMTEARNSMIAQGKHPDDNRANRRRMMVLAHKLYQQRIVDDSGNAAAWDEANRMALDATFTQEPRGWLGTLAGHIEKFTNTFPPAKLLIPFTRVAANITNHMLEWTPYGYMRWAFSDSAKIEDIVDGEKVRRRDHDIAIRATLGMAAIIALMLTLGGEDEEDPEFMIYADGPRDRNLQRQMKDRGWRPFTIKIGDAYISYLQIPAGMALAMVGRMWDDYREGKISNPSWYDIATPSTVMALFELVTEQSFLASISDILAMRDSPNPVEQLEKMIARTSTVWIPNGIKQLERHLDPTVSDGDGFWESVLKEVPIVRGNALKPMLNVFGEPVQRQRAHPWLPGAERFVTFEKTDDPVFNMLGKKRITVPGFSPGVKLNKVKMTEEQYYEYVAKAGPQMKQAIQAELVRLNQMEHDDVQNRVREIAEGVKARVRAEMAAKYK